MKNRVNLSIINSLINKSLKLSNKNLNSCISNLISATLKSGSMMKLKSNQKILLMFPMQSLANLISKIINLTKISSLIKMFPLDKIKNKMYHRDLRINKKTNKKIKELTLIDSKMPRYFCSSLQLQIILI